MFFHCFRRDWVEFGRGYRQQRRRTGIASLNLLNGFQVGMLEGFERPLQLVESQATSASTLISSRGGIVENCTSKTFPKSLLSSVEVMLRSN